MADPVMDKLVEQAVEAGTEATSLLFQIMEQNRRDAEWVGNTIREADERHINSLEQENADLRAELAEIRGRIKWLLFGGDNSYNN